MNKYFLTSIHWVLIALYLPLLSSGQQFEMLDAHIICPEEIGWSGLALGDIDNDGDLDLIADSYRYPAYYLNDGTGSFSERTEIPFEYPFQERGVLTLIDMDGDMDLDLVMSTGGLYADVIWMSNDGTAGFSDPVVINSDDERVRDYQVVDLDMDGDQDVLMSLGWTATGGEKVVWYINDGAGEFGTQQLIRSGANSLVRAMDLEDDGDMDVVRYHASDELSWLANDGTMGFTVESAAISTSATVRMIRISDMDGDDDLDLVLSESADGLVEWFANDGIGGFMFGGGIEETGPITHMELVDIDADTDIDVLIQDANGLALYSNDGMGELLYEEVLSPESEAGYYFIAGDIDADGDQDVIDSHFNDPIYIHRFESGGPIVRQGLSSFILEPNWCNAADIDGDGDLDAVSSTPFGEEVAWYDNPGSGFDLLPWSKTLISTELPSPDRIIPADMDDDGDQDLVVTSSINGGGLAYLEQGPIGTWSFTPFPIAPSGIIASLNLADIDGDDDLDILYSTANVQTVSLIRNQGGGTFDSAIDLVSLENYANSIETPDLDGDGLHDLLLASRFGDEVVWFKNLGGETYGEKQTIYQNAGTLFNAHASDLDADGDMEVLVTDAFYDEILYFTNDGTGDFGPPQMVGPANGVNMTTTEDMDGDGDLDVVFGGSFAGVYYNDGSAHFGPVDGIYPSNGGLYSEVVHPFDMDGDGDLDVLKAMSSSDQVDYAINHLGEGCMDPVACNYEPSAIFPTGDCCYDDCGCTDPIAVNYDADAVCDDGNCQYIQGCTDLLAENYNPDATADDGSCVFIYGCTDPLANNYEPMASIDDQSCLFDVMGYVFHDLNENGFEEPDEYGLAGQEVYLLPDSILGFTNEQGFFNFSDLDYGYYSVGINNDTIFPFNTTLSELGFSVYLSEEADLSFGISDEAPLAQVQVFSIPFGNALPCGETYNYRVGFRNMGNFSFDGTISYAYDSLYTDFLPVTPVDSVNENTIFTSFQNLLPGELRVHDYQFTTPPVDFLGDTLIREIILWATQIGDTVAYGQWIEDHTLNCAYDPNDKQVSPIGYTDEHFVHPDSLLHYQIRFQNTGTATAIDVLITDTLDINLELSTFQFIESSHLSYTTLDPQTRAIEFDFPEIMLPDSANEPLGSQGFVMFSIRPSTEALLLTEINNGANIYFDNNPPIVTNTTWSTLYDCSLFEVNFMDVGAVLTASDGDSYQWFLDGEVIEEANEQEYTALENGNYSVQVGIDFPCSDTSSSTFIVVNSIDEVADSSVVLFPNPMTTSAILDVGEFRGPIRLEMYDLSGKLIRSEQQSTNNGQLRIERGDLVSGRYLLRVISGQETIDLPFVVG